jgi:hypothetical protein
MLMVAYAVKLGLFKLFATTQIEVNSCSAFTRQPTLGQIELDSCGLDLNEMLLVSEGGEIEKLSMRRKGLSMHPLSNVQWAHAYAPVLDPQNVLDRTRVLYDVTSPELLQFLNAFERANESAKQKMFENPVLLRRMEKTVTLMGRAQKPELFEDLQAVLGNSGSPFLVLVKPGLPQPSPPIAWDTLFIALLGLACFAYAILRRPTSDPEFESQMPPADDAMLKLGQLDKLKTDETHKS